MDTNLEKMFLIQAQSLLFQKRNLTLSPQICYFKELTTIIIHLVTN